MDKNKIVDYSEKVLEVKNLKKYFKVGVGKNKLVVPAVDDVTFDVYKREVFGLVGESGSGKTTTGRTIIKLYNPTEGYVKLNGITISAGYADHIENIKNIKKQAKIDILSLKASELQKLQLKEKAEKDIEYIRHELTFLIPKEKEELAKANLPLDEYKTKLYELKNQMKLDIETIEYDYNIEVEKIHQATLNKAETEMNKELEILRVNYERKVEGLKDSAALSKEVINERLQELKSNYEADIERIKKEFSHQIIEASAEVMSKEDAKAKIQALTLDKKQKIQKVKEKYQEARNNVVAPDMNLVKSNIQSVKEKYKNLRKEIFDKIAAVKAQLKKDLASVVETQLSEEEKRIVKEKAKAINEKAKAAILVEKQHIEEAKRVNHSSETLKASRKMQMIFQDPISSLNPRMTVREIIGEGLVIQGNLTNEQINAKVEEVLNLVGLAPEYATRYPHEFSGGQRQRIGIARALIMEPNFIIADEPISALDVSIRAQVLNLLTNLKEQLGLTILFIAHDLSVVRFFCDRIAVMYNGRIVEMASSEELFANPMHAYTISLLSAIPQPDPDYEKGRQRIHYNPSMHDYRIDKPSLREIAPNHLVYANDKEFEEMKKRYVKSDSKK